MEAVSVASSIAGLVTLALQVSGTIVDYATAIKDKTKNINELKDELSLLCQVLTQLGKFIAVEEVKGLAFGQSSVLRKAIFDCESRIGRIKDKLQPNEGRLSRALDKMTWPFDQKAIIQHVENLRRYTQIFQFALTAKGCEVLSMTSDSAKQNLTETLKQSKQISEMLVKAGLSAEETVKQSEILEQMSKVITQLLQDNAKGLRETSQSAHIAEQREQQRLTSDVLDWLCPKAVLQKHEVIQAKRAPGTGKWFLKHNEFINWTERHLTDDLLAYGQPGVGKSVLTSIVIDHLKKVEQSPDVAVVYYYCDYNEKQSQSPKDFTKALLRQLCMQKPSIPSTVAEFYRRTKNDISDQIWFDELQSILQLVVATFKKCFFLIDALDEFDKRMDALKILHKLRKNLSTTSILIFATTRPHTPDLKDFTEGPSAVVEVKADESDLRSFLSRQIRHHSNPGLKIDEALEEKILDKLCENSRGMFLLPALHIQDILESDTISEVKRGLETIPSSLNEVYEATIKRIRHLGKRRGIALRTLMWLSHVKRPLHVDELRHALAVRFDDIDLDTENLPDPTTLLERCCGLIEIDNKTSTTSTIRLVHLSLEEYLQSEGHTVFEEENVDLAITRTCLKYLSFSTIETLAPQNRANYNASLAQWPFLRYASVFWGSHAKDIRVEQFQDLALPFLKNGKQLQVAERTRVSEAPDVRNYTVRMSIWACSGGAGISVAASFGLTELVKLLIEGAARPVLNARNVLGSTPLHDSAVKGNEKIAELLIANNADVADLNHGGNTPLFLAVAHEQLSMVQTLLKHGQAQLSIPCNRGWTALHKAAELGNSTIVETLLRAEAPYACKAVRDENKTALQLAAKGGHYDVVKSLVLAGAVVDDTDSAQKSALDYAAARGHSRILRFLIENGAVVNKKGNDSWTPLHRSARGGHVEATEVLLAHGALLFVPDHAGNIPIHLAVRSGSVETVKRLLHTYPELRAAQLTRRNNKGARPSVVALYTSQFEIKKMLRATEVEILRGGEISSSKLTQAIEGGTLEEVQLLLEEDKSAIDALGDDDLTLLHLAMQEGRVDVAELLLAKGASIERKGYHGWRPLHMCAARGHLELVDLCILQGADIHAVSDTQETALHKASSSDSVEVVLRLLQAGANLNAVNERGLTPLSVAAHHNNMATAQLLVQHGADISVKDKTGASAVVWAKISDNLEIVDFLEQEQRKRRKRPIG